MIFIYGDPAGDRIEIEAITAGGQNCLSLDAYETGGEWTTIRIPFEDVEQFIAGIREQVRQAAA